MTLAKLQRGTSFFSVMIMLVLVGFVGLFAIKLTPVYMEYFNVRSVIASFGTDSTSYPTVLELNRAIETRLSINDVRSVTAADVLVEPDGTGYSLHVDYEVRVPFISNIFLLVKFSENGQVRGGGAT